MKQFIKKVLNILIKKTINYRLVSENEALDAPFQVWKKLAEKGFRPKQIVDLGAAKGSWTKGIIEVFPEAKVFMVDPLEENTLPLKGLAGTHAGKVEYWKGAIGNTTGKMSIYAHGDQTSMYKSEWGGDARQVEMRTLASFIEDGTIHNADIIKLDVQGAELDILKGSEKVIESCNALQVEVSFRKVYESAPLAHEIISFLAAKGFRIYDISQTFKRNDRALIQADLFFVSEERWFVPETFKIVTE